MIEEWKSIKDPCIFMLKFTICMQGFNIMNTSTKIFIVHTMQSQWYYKFIIWYPNSIIKIKYFYLENFEIKCFWIKFTKFVK